MIMSIQVNVVGKKYIMTVKMGDYESTHAAHGLIECLDVAKRVVRRCNYYGKMSFKVITHGHDANGSPITELVTEADG
jgi:hypothetical protein